MKRTGRLRPRSKKTAAKYVERRKIVAALLEAFPWCQLAWDSGCEGRAVDVDEIRSRAAGGSILDENNLQTACRHCHRMKHEHPAEAHARGLTLRSWDRSA